MKPKEKTNLLPLILFVLLIVLAFLIAAVHYCNFIKESNELVIDNCYVRGITYDGVKTLLVVELPDHTLAIVDATIRLGGRQKDMRPYVFVGDLVRCRWENSDLSKAGYCNWEKGDVRWRSKYLEDNELSGF